MNSHTRSHRSTHNSNLNLHNSIILSKHHTISKHGNITTKITHYQYGNLTYLQATSKTLSYDSHNNNKYWTVVQHRKRNISQKIYFFVGNIPPRASSNDIWAKVKGEAFLFRLYLPQQRDINNNHFAFLLLKEALDAKHTLLEFLILLYLVGH